MTLWPRLASSMGRPPAGGGGASQLAPGLHTNNPGPSSWKSRPQWLTNDIAQTASLAPGGNLRVKGRRQGQGLTSKSLLAAVVGLAARNGCGRDVQLARCPHGAVGVLGEAGRWVAQDGDGSKTELSRWLKS